MGSLRSLPLPLCLQYLASRAYLSKISGGRFPIVVEEGFADLFHGGAVAFDPFVDFVAAGVGRVVLLAHGGICDWRLFGYVIGVCFGDKVL